MTDALEMLKTRRSVSSFALKDPAPDPAQLEQLLTVAVRVPDHGKLVPWRFVVMAGDAVPRFCAKLAGFIAADEPDATPERLRTVGGRFAAPLIVTVVSRAAEHVKIPVWEQVLSVGAVCMNLEHAAFALGFGTEWITGWGAYDPRVKALLGVAQEENIAGFILIGTPSSRPEDRPRPDLSDLVTRWTGA